MPVFISFDQSRNGEKGSSEPTSSKGLPESLEVGDFGDRLALFLALADGLSRITERNNGQDFQFIWDAQERFHLVQSSEAHPVRPDPYRPGRIARLASETENIVLSIATTIAGGAPARYRVQFSPMRPAAAAYRGSRRR